MISGPSLGSPSPRLHGTKSDCDVSCERLDPGAAIETQALDANAQISAFVKLKLEICALISGCCGRDDTKNMRGCASYNHGYLFLIVINKRRRMDRR
jgi:hypothetical protein